MQIPAITSQSNFRCEKEEDLAMIAAQQYFIEYGSDLNSERLFNLLPNYIPDYCLQRDNAMETWHQLIIQAYKKVTKESFLSLKRAYINLFYFRATT